MLWLPPSQRILMKDINLQRLWNRMIFFQISISQVYSVFYEDSQSVIFKVFMAARQALYQLHLAVEAFRYSVILGQRQSLRNNNAAVFQSLTPNYSNLLVQAISFALRQRLWNEDFEKTDFKKIHRHFENIIRSAERYPATKNACLQRVISSL